MPDGRRLPGHRRDGSGPDGPGRGQNHRRGRRPSTPHRPARCSSPRSARGRSCAGGVPGGSLDHPLRGVSRPDRSGRDATDVAADASSVRSDRGGARRPASGTPSGPRRPSAGRRAAIDWNGAGRARCFRRARPDRVRRSGAAGGRRIAEPSATPLAVRAAGHWGPSDRQGGSASPGGNGIRGGTIPWMPSRLSQGGGGRAEAAGGAEADRRYLGAVVVDPLGGDGGAGRAVVRIAMGSDSRTAVVRLSHPARRAARARGAGGRGASIRQASAAPSASAARRSARSAVASGRPRSRASSR